MISNSRGQPPQSSDRDQQRKFKRYAVNLNGVCHLANGTDIGCEIKDVCLSGMYIVFSRLSNDQNYTSPATGENIELECFFPTPKSIQTININAKIVRLYEKGVGIVFNNPKPATLNTLNTYIRSLLSDNLNTQFNTDQPTTHLTAIKPLELVANCHTLIKTFAPTLINKFIGSFSKESVSAASEASNNTEQNIYFDAANMIINNSALLSTTFLNSVQAQLQTNTITSTDKKSDYSSHYELSIMGDESFEQWLAVKNIINQAQTDHVDIINELNLRLSMLFGEQITTDNNPFGPNLYAQAFNDSLKSINLDHKMNLFCDAAFSKVLSILFGGICDDLNKLLNDNGINPVRPPRKMHADNADKPAQTTREPVEPCTGQNVTANTQNHHITVSDEPGRNKNVSENTDNSNSASSHATYIPAHHSASPNTDKQHNIYQLFNDLKQIKAQIAPKYNGGVGINTAGNTTTNLGDTQPVEEFSIDEIVNALSSLQLEKVADTGNFSQQKDLGTRTLLALKGDSESSNTNKMIGARNSNVINVTTNLFESLLQDMLVADSVRDWINKLEIPILKLALKDDSIFTDKNHIARQVLNKISQLEGYTQLPGLGIQNAVCNKIEKLLDRVTQDIDTNPGIFKEALKEVNTLIKVQNTAYDENVLDVINACNKEYAANTKIANNSESPVDRKTWHPWEKQAYRLNVGAWLYFSDPSNNGQRLRLAWVSRNRDRFVFVNLKGIKEQTLSFEQLSRRLRDSSIIVLESADDMALDRAQHNMLDKMHKQLIFESTHDQLTGLINRREFERLLEARLSQQNSIIYQDALCFLEIDQFDIINSTYGYDAGDKLFIDFSALLLRSLNGKGTLARVNGNAYALLVENHTAAEARELIKQHLEILKEFRFTWEDNNITVSLSIGMVPITDFEAVPSELLQIAEKCCHTSKEKGGNHIDVYQRNDQTEEMHNSIMQYVLQIDDTIANNNIELLCQKIAPVQAGDKKIAHHSEIIIRVRDNKGNFIPTQDFILAAEHHHRITTLDRWVIASTLKWMAANKEQMEIIGGFAINLSGRSLNDESFLEYVLDQVTQSQVPTEWICFEITETADIDSLSDASEFINKIKETGCHFSLDDFGSGLSSYAYLKSLPVDYLKIDGAFVKNMHENPEDYAVVKSICEIGHFMGKRIIAEFVENEMILDKLREIGVDYAQGYHIQKPTPLINYKAV